MTYDFTVAIQGQDYDPVYGWGGEHYHLEDVPCDSYEDAVAYCDAITTDQVLEWERRSRCNGLDVVIFADPVMDDGTYELGFHVVGEYEWIGADRNLRDVWKAADVSNLGR